MARAPRHVPLCERHCGCPTCKVKPGQQCVTLASYYTFAPYGPGYKTAPHKARERLYAYLWRLA